MAGGGGDKGKSTQTTEVKLPEWVNQASQANYKQAQEVANRPYEAYPGQQVAGFNPTQQQAFGMLPGLGQYQGAYGSAQNALQGLLGFNPSQVQAGAVHAGQVGDADLSRYMNPYTENVIDRTVSNMERSGAQAQNKLSSDAAAAKSFGGSRQAMQQAIQGAETTRGIGDYAGKAREANFAQAQAAATADINRALTGDTTNLQNWTDVQKANASNQLLAAGVQKSAADSLVAAATAGQESAIKTLGQYLGVGGMQQQQQQKELDVTKGNWQQQHDYPLEQLNILLSSLGMSPYGKTETTNKTSEQKSGTDFGGLLGGFMQMAPAIMAMSDRTMKTDITKLGADEATGVPMYAYRYKGDPKTYPKVVGPMAQDIEKQYPKLIRKVAGKKAIDLTRLAA